MQFNSITGLFFVDVRYAACGRGYLHDHPELQGPGVEPYAYLKDVLERLPSMTNRQIPGITPKAWAEAQRATLKAAA